jgi:hypothetical protein
MLWGYKDATIILSEKAWDKQELPGRILLLADPFSYHVQWASGTEPNGKKAWEGI